MSTHAFPTCLVSSPHVCETVSAVLLEPLVSTHAFTTMCCVFVLCYSNVILQYLLSDVVWHAASITLCKSAISQSVRPCIVSARLSALLCGSVTRRRSFVGLVVWADHEKKHPLFMYIVGVYNFLCMPDFTS